MHVAHRVARRLGTRAVRLRALVHRTVPEEGGGSIEYEGMRVCVSGSSDCTTLVLYALEQLMSRLAPVAHTLTWVVRPVFCMVKKYIDPVPLAFFMLHGVYCFKDRGGSPLRPLLLVLSEDGTPELNFAYTSIILSYN